MSIVFNAGSPRPSNGGTAINVAPIAALAGPTPLDKPPVPATQPPPPRFAELLRQSRADTPPAAAPAADTPP
ncbi:MAG: hypothetical protein M3Z15_08945, partial [Pseudomonadota bacterium]|nr:hypothetical protein [Pseudomonadota bacterium]